MYYGWTPESVAALAEQSDYNDMGEAKPIRTDWQRTATHCRTVDGAQEYEYICAFCGETQWSNYWKDLPEHICRELDSLFNNSPQGADPGDTNESGN